MSAARTVNMDPNHATDTTTQVVGGLGAIIGTLFGFITGRRAGRKAAQEEDFFSEDQIRQWVRDEFLKIENQRTLTTLAQEIAELKRHPEQH